MTSIEIDKTKLKIPMTKQKFINLVMMIIVVIALCLSGYFYYKLHTIQKDIAVNDKNKQEAKDLLGKVAKLYLIPTGEEPTIATVSDPTALKSQSFFTQSQKGDKVLIFSKAGRAVLYRPSIDKIIETAPISNPTNDQITTPPETTSDPIKDKSF